MIKNLLILVLASLLVSCGSDDPLDAVKTRVRQLEIISGALDAAINSDFATCANSGNTVDPFINKVCNIARAAVSEQLVEWKAGLGILNQSLQGQIDAINANLVSQQASIDTINSQLSTINTTLTSLDARMTSAETAITALQTLTASINGTLAGNMISLDIGSENVSAGPLYETVLRRNDKKRFNGYVQAFGAAQGFGNNPLTASNGSATVTVALTAHGYLAGDIVALTGLTGSRGFSNGEVYGEFVVQTAATNTFTLLLSVNASSNGTLGGSAGSVQKVLGRGMGTLWKSLDPSDVAVRVSNLGTKRYNFIIRRRASDVSNNTAELCYSSANNLATFATINAAAEGGAGSIVCK